jgi:hypothetical protein
MGSTRDQSMTARLVSRKPLCAQCDILEPDNSRKLQSNFISAMRQGSRTGRPRIGATTIMPLESFIAGG